MSSRSQSALPALVLTISLAAAGGAIASEHRGVRDHGTSAEGRGQDVAPQPQRHGKGGKARPGAPASGRSDSARSKRPAGRPPKRAPASRRSGKAHGKPASNAPRRSSSAPRPRNASEPQRTARAPQAAAGKTTICHATGSSTNPYVEITVSDNALKAHRAHQDGRDIVPAPAGGCPDSGAAARGARTTARPDRTTICHATGSSTNPYVRITVADSALKAHREHQDGRDIIPAPDGPCEGTATAAGLLSGGMGDDGPASAGGVLGAMAERGAAAPGSGMLGAAASGAGVLGVASESGSARRESGGGAPRTRGPLPFTGAEAAMLLALGLAIVLAGLALRRSVVRRTG